LVSERHTLAARALAVRPMVWIGRVSYSLYLWQELFCNRNSTMWWARFPLNVVLAFLFAAMSYYWVERPVLAWRDRQRRS
jgi:peptidoglycan/LPS O-acetylase OafA/YrhL